MVRTTNAKKINLSEQTLSSYHAMTAAGHEAFLRDHCLGFGLYHHVNDDNIQQLWDLSYDAEENEEAGLPAAREVEGLIRSRLVREAALLTLGEHMILEIMMNSENRLPLFSDSDHMLPQMTPDALGASVSLVRRLWCWVEADEAGTYWLRISDRLSKNLDKLFNTAKHKKLRENLFRWDCFVKDMLYLFGYSPASEPLSHLLTEVLVSKDPSDIILCERFFSAGYRLYFPDEESQPYLLHPAVIDPERMIRTDSACLEEVLELTAEEMTGAYHQVMPDEQEACQMMNNALSTVIRSDYTEDEMVDDLRYLAKQGVTEAELLQLISNRIISLPSPQLKAALHRLCTDTRPWIYSGSNVLN